MARTRIQDYIKQDLETCLRYLGHLKTKLRKLKKFARLFNKLVQCKGHFSNIYVARPLVKRLCQLLVKNEFIPYEWLLKPQIEINAKNINLQGLRVLIFINDIPLFGLLD